MTRSQPRHRDPEFFLRSDALRSGWTDSAIRHAITAGRWESVRRGAYHPRSDDGDLFVASAAANVRAARAAQASCATDLVLSHGTAAIVHGLPTITDLSRSCVTVQRGTAARNRAGVHLHRAALPDEQVSGHSGASHTSIERTVADVSREHGPSAGVVVADAALRRGISGEQLQAVIAQQRSWPGAARARRVLALCDGRSESPLESLSRLRMIDSGLPAPTLQAEIGDLRGTFIARVDFYWDGYGIVGEADGAAKYTELRVLLAEQRRQNLLSEMGLIVVRWGWSELAAFDVVADRFRRATARGLAPSSRARGWSVLSDLCPTRPWPNSSSRSQR